MKHNEYFRKFPLISYKGTPAVDILTRVDFQSNIRKYFDAFYKYTLQDGEKIEDVAFNMYNDVDLDWLLLHANDIIDPYYDVPLDNQTFDAYIIKRYGSIEIAKRSVYAYRNNWRADASILDVVAFNALAGAKKKYWQPAQGALGMTIGYERNRDDYLTSTNIVISLSYATDTTDTFAVGTYVTAGTATAQVAGSSDGIVTLQHIEGDWDREVDFTVTDVDNTLTVTVQAATYLKLTDVIPIIEQIYYSQYSVYQYELDTNERRRNIYLVSDGSTSALNKQLTDLLK